MGKPKSSWLVGAITVLIVTAGCVFLVITTNTSNKLVSENDCDQGLVCHFRPWWEPTPQRAVSATFSTPVPVTSSQNMKTESTHPQLAKRTTAEIPVEETVSIVDDNHLAQEYNQAGDTKGSNDNQVQENNQMQKEAQVGEDSPIQEDEQTQDNYVEEGRHQEQSSKETTIQEETKPDGLEIDADTASENIEPFEICRVNGDCGLGYRCLKGLCRPGCSKHLDCPKWYECRYGRYGHRCFEKTGWHRECRFHLRFCSRHSQCCSGYCGRRSKGKELMCRRKPDDLEVEK